MTVIYRPKTLWITRSSPFGLAIARQCGSEGIPAIPVPVLHVTPLAVSRPDEVPDAIVFTSTHGVRNHPYQPKWKEVPVLTVGDRTAEQAIAKGYLDVRSAAGDLRDLKVLIARAVRRPARLFVFGAPETAGLNAHLRRSGYRAKHFVVYETRPSSDAELRDAINLLDRIDGICVYSPKAAERVSEMLIGRTWRGTIFCLSLACAERVEPRDGVDVAIAEQPNDGALRHLVRRKWGLSQPLSGSAPRAPSLELRRFRSATRKRLSEANDNAHFRQCRSHSAEGEDQPPPSAA